MKTFNDYMTDDRDNIQIALAKFDNRYEYARLEYVMEESLVEFGQREVEEAIMRRETLAQQAKKEQAAQKLAYEYTKQINLDELMHLRFEHDWDLFLELCDEAVVSAKNWLSVEEKLAALDEYYSSLGL